MSDKKGLPDIRAQAMQLISDNEFTINAGERVVVVKAFAEIGGAYLIEAREGDQSIAHIRIEAAKGNGTEPLLLTEAFLDSCVRELGNRVGSGL